MPPTHFPLRRAADILSRVLSQIRDISNSANDSRMFRVNRPIDVVVLNCWVTETRLTPRCSKVLISRAKSSSERLSRSTLYTSTQSMRPWSAGSDHLILHAPPELFQCSPRASSTAEIRPRHNLGLYAQHGAWRVANDRIGVGPKLAEFLLQRASADQN